MARSYTCIKCGERATTDNARGPLPENCTKCRARTGKTGQRAPTVQAVQAQSKAAKALIMRRDYHTWDQIAEACGYSSAASAYNACKNEMARKQQEIGETIDEIRSQEIQRLERLGSAALAVLENTHLVINSGQVVHFNEQPLVDDAPVLAAVKTLVQVSESMRKLLGLDAAQKVAAEVSVKYTVEGIPEGEMP